MKLSIERALPYILAICGVFGMLASFALTYDKVQILQTPNYTPSCNINPIFSCGSIMSSEQSSVFGVPNSIFGIAAFSVLTAFGILLLAKAQFNRKVWLVAQIAATVGVIYMHYLFFQGVYRINAICPWCFVVWMFTIPVFWSVSVYNLRKNYLKISGKLNFMTRFIKKYPGEILFVWYLIIFLILLERFWYYWSTLI